ncbi:alpha/beta fold hydrolase [Pseudonocardiaceae bacterium YIM PH 21723]|nr:alpha/beta fold hydrolase [Pseudonocardiaceae bacterium YIM PH 21723]
MSTPQNLPGPQPDHVSITGGAGGFRARYEDLNAMGKLTDEVAEDTVRIAATSHGFLAEPDVLASAILDPAGAARFEAAMARALDGAHGLTATSVEVGLRGAKYRASAAAYELSDELSRTALEGGKWLAGRVVGAAPGALVGAAALAAADVYLNYGGDWDKWIGEHPGVIDALIGGAPGFVSGLLGVPLSQAQLMELLAGAYPDGEPVVKELRLEHPKDPDQQIHGLYGIMRGLEHRDDDKGFDPNRAENIANVDVRQVVGADGVTRWVVDIPGTRELTNSPWSGTHSANDAGVNLDGMAGNPTVLEKGIREAMAKAGVQQGDPVMLVGHSQGGIVAGRAATDLQDSYNVTHVVTAGSPVANIPVPDKVQMLSLENNNDIVPKLDGSPGQDRPNHTTVSYDAVADGVMPNHRIHDNYVRAAADLDQSQDPSIKQFRESADGFLNGEQKETHTYRVSRQ